MSIYLSWSVVQLLVVVLLTTVAIYLIRNMVGNRKLFAIPYIVVLVFNVGERQQSLNRSSFNNNSVEVVDKVEVGSV